MNYTVLLIIGLAIIMIFVIISSLVKRYKRCPSDKLLVIYGKTGKKESGEISTAKVLHGGGAFIWPIIQDYEFLDLKPIAIDVDLRKALSKQNIRVDVPATFTVAISTEPDVMQNAAERLLGQSFNEIASLAKDIIFGQMRLVIATMDIEEINSDRDKFLESIQKSLEPELQKIGLRLINVNVTDIKDESGYIEALGQEAAAEAVNNAKVSVAEKNRDGEIGETKAVKEQRIEVAKAESEAKIGEANADQAMRTATANANAIAIDGENKAAIDVANSTASRKVAEAEATKKATVANNVKQAEALKDSYEAQTKAENERAARDKATQYANVVIPAEIEKEKIEIDASAEAEQIRRVAQGNADAKYAMMAAEARGIEEILSKTAEGYDKLVKAAGSPEGAVSMILADKLEKIIAVQAEAIKGVKIDNITVWDSGNGNGEGGTAGFLQSFFKFLPPMEDTFKMVGQEMPAFLQGAGEATKKKIEAGEASNKKEENKDTMTNFEEVE